MEYSCLTRKAIGTTGLSEPDAEHAIDYAIECPYCGTLNRVWLTNPKMTKREGSVGIRARIVKKNPIGFK